MDLAPWLRKNGASGLEVVHAYAVSAEGVPLGVFNQQSWGRGATGEVSFENSAH